MVASELCAAARALVERLSKVRGKLADQLDRASVSIVLSPRPCAASRSYQPGRNDPPRRAARAVGRDVDRACQKARERLASLLSLIPRPAARPRRRLGLDADLRLVQPRGVPFAHEDGSRVRREHLALRARLEPA